ncbi:hypothetical protein NSP_50810 [Nodularia spumigena CCY9414]|nr:hypothetical protein NSP_50810 [Nodularia spumigena CCY9414]EAW44075.1 hypothetical protein N9414_08999 [Nodularia spumigena CCY9414]
MPIVRDGEKRQGSRVQGAGGRKRQGGRVQGAGCRGEKRVTSQ